MTWRRVSWITAALLSLAVGATVHASGAPRLLFTGCAEVLDGPTCELGDERRLSLFVAHAANAEVAIQPPAEAVVETFGGSRVEIVVPPETSQVRIDVDDPTGSRRLDLTVRSTPPDPPWLKHARTLDKAGHLDTACEIYERWTDRGSAADRALAWRWLSWCAMDDEARLDRTLAAAVDASKRAGHLLSTSRWASWLHTHRRSARRFAEARQLDAEWPESQGEAIIAFDRVYHPALRARDTGDARRALALLDQAHAIAERVGLVSYMLAADEARGDLLLATGRYREVQALLTCRLAASEQELPPCFRAKLLNSFAWSRLLERDGPGADPWHRRDFADLCPAVDRPDSADLELLLAGEPRAILDAALDRFTSGCPEQTDELTNVRMNLALADLQDGRTERAARSLDALRATPPHNAEVVLWDWTLRSRLALGDGQAQVALDRAERLAELAHQTGWLEGRWRAAVGQAQALDALGQTDAAIEAYALAERHLDTELMALPRYFGRIDFANLRRLASGDHIELLISQGRTAEALAVARRGRSRFARSLRIDPTVRDAASREYFERRDAVDAILAESWSLSQKALGQRLEAAERGLDALRRDSDARSVESTDRPSTDLGRDPSPGELVLTLHETTEGWWLFAQDTDGVEAHRLPPIDTLDVAESRAAGQSALEPWAEWLLAPVAERVRRAKRLRIAPQAELYGLDIHALPFDGAPLIETVAVAYALDLPPVARFAGPAVVISDPAGDLAGARREAAGVVERLAAFGDVRHLEGSDADGEAVRRALDGAGHLHYAGHAHFAGWRSHLPLADSSRLVVDDILALPRPPETVVLAGCQAGRSIADDGRESFDLARAFAVAGARAVIAATRDVDDHATRALIDALYAAWMTPEGSTRDAAAALRNAQRHLRETDPDADWSAFRLVER